MFQHKIFIKISCIVNAIINYFAVVIQLSFVRDKAFNITVKENTNYTIWGKESIVNALLERICINWLAEIVNVRNRICFLWCSRQANLCSSSEIFEHFTPLTICLCAATMALVYNNKIEEAWTELLKQTIRVFVFAGKPLVERKVYFVGSIKVLLCYPCHLILERCKVISKCLGNQCRAICEEQNALFYTRLPQSPNNLKRCICFAGTGCHYK